jgi:hypothetical protein
MLLLAAGVIMVLSASYPRAWYDPGHVTGGNAAYYFIRQLIFALLGVGAMLLASRVPMAVYRRWAFPFLLFSLVLLALVPVIGVRANGSRRWLGVGGLTLQPSELAKLAVILSFAVLICRFRGKMRSFRFGILPFAGILGAIVLLLVLEPHVSASVIILAIGAVMLFLGGVRLKWFVGAFGAAGAGVGSGAAAGAGVSTASTVGSGSVSAAGTSTASGATTGSGSSISASAGAASCADSSATASAACAASASTVSASAVTSAVASSTTGASAIRSSAFSSVFSSSAISARPPNRRLEYAANVHKPSTR